MKKKFLLWGLIYGLLAVIIGAFGTHALKSILSAEQQAGFETGIRYQFYHALLLIILSNIPKIQSRLILYALSLGIFLFSFSIYLLMLRFYLNMDFLKFLGPITPIGGSLLIFSWILLIIKTVQLKLNSD